MPAVRFDFRIEKASPTGRYVSGWLSVVEKDGKPVEDTQGDIVAMEEARKAFHKYMRGSRVIKSQHAGDGIGDLVECVIIDDDFAKAHGVTHGQRGVWGTAEITDEKEQARVRKGEYGGFSIGGRGKRSEIKKAAGKGLMPRGRAKHGLAMRALERAMLNMDEARNLRRTGKPSQQRRAVALEDRAKRLWRMPNYLASRQKGMSLRGAAKPQRRTGVYKSSPGASDVHVDGVMSTKKPLGGARVRFTLSKRARLARRALSR